MDKSEEDNVIHHTYSFNKKKVEFDRMGKIGKNIIKEFSDYMKVEHQFDFENDVMKVFNHEFKFSVECKFNDITNCDFKIRHQRYDHALKLIASQAIYTVPLKEITNYGRHETWRIYSVMLGAMLDHLNKNDCLLIADVVGEEKP
jgi:hypothetical protein